MGADSFGRCRVHRLTVSQLEVAGIPPEAAFRLAQRQQAAGEHPPLSSDEASKLLGCENWLPMVQLYADAVALQETSVTLCASCRGVRLETDDRCPLCDASEVDIEYQWAPLAAGRLRHPQWIIFLHGMKTRGSWQEKLSWQLSLIAPTSNPVRIHKYGKLVIRATNRRYLRHLALNLAEELHRLEAEAKRSGRDGPADIIAHSLGTWLIGHALRLDPTLRVGRVILTGATLSPAFEWDELVRAGRVEAVLNHRAGSDKWVPLAQYLIPDSGPSGRVGFLAKAVVDVVVEDWGHSSFFEDAQGTRDYPLTQSLDSLWKPFLVWTQQSLAELGDSQSVTYWIPSRFGRGRLVK